MSLRQQVEDWKDSPEYAEDMLRAKRQWEKDEKPVANGELRFSPMPHQKLAVDHLDQNDVSLLIAGMGLGKTASTLQSISNRSLDGDCKGVLIVAPLRVAVLTWPDEVAKWKNFSWMRVANLRTEAGKQAWRDGLAEIYVINYEALPKFSKEFINGVRPNKMPVDAVVFDEISIAKNPSSKRINAFRKFIPKFKIRYGLTGTPLPNSHLDLFAQIRLLDEGKRFGPYSSHYRKDYFTIGNADAVMNGEGVRPKYVLREGAQGKIESKIADMTLTLLSEDYLDIPPTRVIDVDVTMPKAAKARYLEMQKKLLILLDSGDKIKAVNMAVRGTKLLQITGGACYTVDEFDERTGEVEHIHDAKIKALRKVFDEEGQEPMIVSCQYRHEIERVKKEFGAVEFSNDKLDDWNAGKIKMLVSHPKSIGHGLNLQAGGSRVVWFTLGYSREIYDQFNARLARTGQKHETKIFRLICQGTIDDAVASTLENKADNQNDFFTILKNLQRLNE